LSAKSWLLGAVSPGNAAAEDIIQRSDIFVNESFAGRDRAVLGAVAKLEHHRYAPSSEQPQGAHRILRDAIYIPLRLPAASDPSISHALPPAQSGGVVIGLCDGKTSIEIPWLKPA
jgi:hypothetical protein